MEQGAVGPSLERALGVHVRHAALGETTGVTPLRTCTGPDGVPYAHVFRTAQGYRLDCFDCIFVETDAAGRNVTVDARPPASRIDVEDLLVSMVLPLMGQLQGQPTIHGSAVAIEGRAFGFLGATGAGKSTLAALLADLGAELVADDTLLLRGEDEGALIQPTASTIRLRQAEKLGIPRERGEERANGRLAVHFRSANQPLRLEHLYVLGSRPDGVRVSPLRPRDAALELAQHLFRMDLQDADFLREELRFIEAVAQRVPMSRLDYPREIGAASEIYRVLSRGPSR